MKTLLNIVLLLVFTTSLLAQFVDPETPEDAKPANMSIVGEWELKFSDEFNGAEVDTEKWRIDNSTKSRAARPKIGIYDWRWKPENVKVENGNLVLEVHKTGENSMTNGSVNSYTKYLTQYGFFEVRIKVGDAAKGTHTAFWLQGPNMGNVDGTANDGAEIDVFETAWTGDFTKSVVHIDGYGTHHQANTKRYETPGIHSGFHTWGFHWTENFMDIYYDGEFKVRYADPKWIVKSQEFLWLSNGASFGLEGDQYFLDLPHGYLTETQVDYIRVWKYRSETDTDESLLKQDTWELYEVDSEDTEWGGNLAVNAFDDNPYTFWFTDWANDKPVHPHDIQIDLGGSASIEAFKYLPRQDGKTNGNIIDYQFFASDDPGDWGEPLVSGTFSGDNSLKTVDLGQTIDCKYVRLVALSDVNGTPYTNVAEIYLNGSYFDDQGDVSLGNSRRLVDLTVFPNPFQQKIYVQLDEGLSGFNQWRIYSMNGKLVKEGSIPGFIINLEIDADGLTDGEQYLLEITGEDKRAVKKLVKY